MAQFPFRKPVNTEDSPDDDQAQNWTPPSYAQASSQEEWKPPDYVKDKPQESEHDKAKKNVTFAGSLKESADFTKKKINDFVSDIVSEHPKHELAARFLTSKDPANESVLPAIQHEPDTYWGGFRKGLYDSFIRPLGSAAGAAGLIGGEEGLADHKVPPINEELPVRQEIPYRAGSSIQSSEPKGMIGDKSPLQIKADNIVNKMTPPEAQEKPVKEAARPVDRKALQARADEILKQIQESQKAPAQEKPTLKLNNDGTFTDTKSGITVDKSGKPVQNDQPLPVRQEQKAKPNFVNPFEKRITPEEFSQDVQSQSQNVTDESGRDIAPPQSAPQGRVNELLAPKDDTIKPKDAMKNIFANASEKFNMGKKLPSQVSNITGKTIRDKDYEKLWGNPDESSYSNALDRHINSISAEVDPDVIRDNYNNWQQEFEYHKIHGSADDIETAGTLRDEALDKLNKLHIKNIKNTNQDWKAPKYAWDPKENHIYEVLPESEEKPTATFAHNQDDFEGGQIPMYTVKGGELDGSTVTAETLKKNNIKVSEAPNEGAPKDTVQKPSDDDITELSGGLGAIGKGRKRYPPSSGPVGPTIDKLFRAVLDAKEKNVEQESINTAERAKRFAAFAGVKAEGAKGAAQSLSKLRGEFDKVEPGAAMGLNPEETDSLFTAIKRSKISNGEKARGYTALFKLMNGDGVPVRSELGILDRVFGNGFADRITEMHGGIGAVGLKVSKMVNTMKSLQNSISLAAPLRHGIGLATRKEFYPAFADMFKFFGDKEFYNSSMDALQMRPKAQLANEAGLFFARPGSLEGSEEEFLNSYAGEIPVAKHLVGASNRAYTGFLNKLRADTFDSMTKRAEELGIKMSTTIDGEVVPSKESKAIANYINVASGRGNLGKHLNKITNELNVVLWSPRMIASRVEMLANPKFYTDLPKGMRLEGLKGLLGIAALGTMIDTLASYAGAKVSTNILSSDAGKARFGNQLIDPWGGFQQYIVAAARFIAGKTDAKQPESRLEIAGRFLANKESPVASFVHSLLAAKKFTGDPNNPKTAGNYTTEYGQKTSVQGEVASRFAPILVQDLYDLIASDPKWSEDIGLTAAMIGASLTGMAQNYPEKSSAKKHLQLR